VNHASRALFVASWIFLTLTAGGLEAVAAQADRPGWAVAMANVHARFHGRPGTLALFGDSITESLAFWTPLKYVRNNASPELDQAFQRVDAYLKPECWRDWRGPEFGSQSRQTAAWADQNVSAWLNKLDPEVALIMFGSNDVREVGVEQYQSQLRSVVKKCLDHGTVVILSTIPPRHGFEVKSAAYADAARQVARELSVPLIDYHAEILKRRPKDWDGSSEAFRAYEGHDVPTLIGRDGIHPSLPSNYKDDYSPEGLRSSGYGLRSYLVLMKYAEVIDALASTSPAAVSGGGPPTPTRSPRQDARSQAAEVIEVANVDALHQAAGRIRPGGTIVLANGVYKMSRTLVIATDRVTVRGKSGRPGDVVLDGGGTLGELLTIRACSDVTVGWLTIQNVRWNGIKIDSETGVQRLTIRACVLRNIWQRAIKGTKVPESGLEKLRPRGCRVEYCLFMNDRPKRFEDDSTDTAQSFDGNYVGGIDVMQASGWTIADNVFLGIRGRTGSARGAVFLWVDVRDCVVERNVVVDCDSGICLGNAFKPPEIATHCTGVVVRNNFVTRAPEGGIVTAYTRDCAILNNTVHEPKSRFGRLIRVLNDNEGLRVENNLLSGPPPSVESTSRITLRNNLSRDMTAGFVDPARGNLRLTVAATAAIDQAGSLVEVTTDIDKKPRDSHPDLGAHEFIPPVMPTPTVNPPSR
jgi:lysophospholipase L1-like esterase